MEDLAAEFAHRTWLPFAVIAARLMLAALLGALVGFEREWQSRPAGLRTHILICVTAALIAIITIEIMQMPLFSDSRIRGDPIRLVEAVTAGVAFLAAGVIVLSKGEIHGLTTGAGMWLAAGIGLACGLGFWEIAVFVTILALVVLGLLRLFEKRLFANRPPPLPVGKESSSDDSAER